ncbi:YbaB/EbfC family nucleoid-associated protein [Nonomuraea pusilla]|uniref:YbaB/EbfC DNA-binding family protein n=1 Tax=Nonomuraea pusilla TaxID=46177 RepID=A0A1H7V933_9ACTN|nr:YbaB/EbfC family nucleoid-associated protein [Nonomuraea pusilla]SEM05590.1 YbaB/EbfC DNA-binding family protein [Nonomuraea pusilla]
MTSTDTHFDPDDLDRVLGDSEKAVRELASALGGLAEVTGTGESRGGAVTARVDASGRLDHLRLSPRASRMELDELTEEIVEAVRAAQDDHQRRATAVIPRAPIGGVSAQEVQRQFEALQDAFARDMHERMARLDEIRRRARDL